MLLRLFDEWESVIRKGGGNIALGVVQIVVGCVAKAEGEGKLRFSVRLVPDMPQVYCFLKKCP